jgi:hypothetical protein
MKTTHHLSDAEFTQEMRRALRALPDAPLHLQRAATALWPAAGAKLGSQLLSAAQMALSQIAAVLSFDSWAVPVLAQGMRSLRSPTRHLLFSAEGRDIDLRISPAAEAFVLAGQILGPDEAGTVQLLAEGSAEVARAVSLDAMGEFRIEGLAAGTYALSLQMHTDKGTDIIVLPPLEVGAVDGGHAG